jgi:FkbM family methyltransferase
MNSPNYVNLGLPLRSMSRLIGHMQWVRTGIRRRIVKRLFDPLKIAPVEFETDFCGLRYNGSFDSVIDWCVYFFGSFAPHELQALSSVAGTQRLKTFWDIGGNTGHHSLFMSKLCRQVHYFEPFPALRERFQSNVELNKIDNVNVHEIGLGAQEDTLTYYAPTQRNLGTGSFLQSHSASNVAAGEIVVRRGDDVCGEEGVAPPDIIKLDVEGFEFDVLRGMQETLSTYKPVVLMEITQSSLQHLAPEDSISEFFPYQHSIYEIRPAKSWGVFFQRPGFRRTRFVPASLGKGKSSQYLLIQATE